MSIWRGAIRNYSWDRASIAEINPDNVIDFAAETAATIFMESQENMTVDASGRLNSARGLGFVRPDEGGANVFMQIPAVERAGLGSQHEVSFEPAPGPRDAGSPIRRLQAA